MRVSVTGLVGVATGQFSVAVTPAGTPETTRFTLLLLKPVWLATPIVLVALLPPTMRLSALAEVEMLKPGLGTVSAMEVELFRFPAVPVTVTA